MDGSRFDRLARSLAAPRTRRRFLAGVAGAGVSLAARDETRAAECPVLSPCWWRRRVGPWGGDDAAPEPPVVAGAAAAVPGAAASDGGRELCDGCERPEREPEPVTCSGGTTDCGGDCRDLGSDSRNCGACGRVCPATRSYCVGGTCAPCRPYFGLRQTCWDGGRCTDIFCTGPWDGLYGPCEPGQIYYESCNAAGTKCSWTCVWGPR